MIRPRTLGTIRLAWSMVYEAGRKHMLMILAATAITSVAIAGQLLTGRWILDALADGTTGARELVPAIVALGILVVVAGLSQAVAGELRLPLGEAVYRRSMSDILDVAVECDLESFDDAEFHNRLQRAADAAGGQSTAVVFGLVNLLSTAVITVGIVGVVATVAPLVLPVAFLGVVPVAIVNVRNNRARYRLELELTELERERTYIEYLLTTRADAKEVRAYGLGRTLLGWHADLWDVRADRLRTLIRKRLRLSGVGSIVTTLVLVATLALALLLAAEGTLTLGDAAVAIVGLQQLSGRLQGAGVAAGSVHEGVVFLRDFEEFRGALPDIRGRRSTGLPPSPPASISVEHVAYRYPGASTDAVVDVSFELRRGQVLAIVGSNGSGKSTLAKLLCGLIAPSRGSISWDGVDLATCDPDLVRRQVAPVFQDFTRFMFSVREVISLGDVDRVGDEEGLLRAAQLSGVDEVIAAHPEGLDVRLGTLFFAGTDLSGGQWQRLAVARALFRDAPIVVMDEPSSSLDPIAEAQLFDVLRGLASDRLVVFVSHRFATVRSADVVMVMERGGVVEIGAHDELMRNGGLYRDLFDVQASRYGFTSSGGRADGNIAADELATADHAEHPARLDQTETSTQ